LRNSLVANPSLCGASIVDGDAIRGPYFLDVLLYSAEGGKVRLDRSEPAWDSFGLVLAAA